jgi:small-conductance mechanosensitive channel
MSSRAEDAARAALRLVRAGALGLALVLAGAGGAGAADASDPSRAPAEWEAVVAEGGALVADAEAESAELEMLRDRLLRLRSDALAFEASASTALADANARMEALGPAPAEGVSEPPEIAARRAEIAAEISAAQVPVLDAQDFRGKADKLIGEIDQIVRARFTAELRSHGPSPLRPRNWVATIEAVVANVAERRAIAAERLSDPVARAALIRRVPIDLGLALVGIAITFVLRGRLVELAERALGQATDARAIAALVALRNFSKLIVPAVGAGLLFGALNPALLFDPTAESPVFDLPDFLVVVIAATWLGSSLFAPKLPAYRLAPVDDAQATNAARLTVALGVLVGAHLFLGRYLLSWDFTTAETATLLFPIFVIGGLLTWQASRLLRSIRRNIVARDRGAPVGERTGTITLGILEAGERGALLVAVAAPLLAAAGFLAAASFFLFGTVLTLGLLGAGVVIFDLLTTLLFAVGQRKGRKGPNLGREGLAPVLTATALTVAAAPLLALVWGARPSEIADVWYMLRDGVTFGGMRISIGMLVSFALVFGLLYGLTRVLQSVLRSTVLPRTRLDAGGKNAVLAGVGYAGFIVASIAAVSSTGLDLTSLAFVAGALSVGIGFGLQNIVSNFVSGIILLVERPIKEGDWIEVGGFSGYVRGISVRSTEIETFDRASVILPNSDLVAGTVLNRTHSGLSGRLQVPVAVTIDSDPRRVEAILLSIAEGYPLVLTEPTPRVLLLELGPDTLLFEIRCWLRDVNFSLSAKSDMNFEIMERFAAEGIRMQPFARDPKLAPPDDPALVPTPIGVAKQA